MAKKLESIVQLAAQTAQQISANSGNYMAFLTTAAHNFKYSFRDQLLIYAQKPDATACAQTDFWNSRGRWVNRGTTGIALLVDTDRGYKLRHVFDMSDTNSRAGRTVPVWQMKPEYEGAVIEGLENSYGELTGKPDLAGCLLETAKVVVEDNFGDYYADLLSVREGSFLEELDEDSVKVWFKGLLENSVGFMLLARCSIDPHEYFDSEDFAHVFDFNTLKTLAILGTTTSDIAEMPLREIATTVLELYREEKKQNRTFASRSESRYNGGRTEIERSVEHGADLQNRGRLPSAQPGRAGSPEGRKIWDAAAQLPGESQARDLHRDAADRGTEQPSGGDRPAGHRDGGEAGREDGGGAGRDGEPESVRPDEVGGPDEQLQGVGGGSGDEGAGVRLSDPLPTEEEQPPSSIDWTAAGPTGLQINHYDFNARSDIPYYHEDSEKQELLRTSDALKDHRTEIAAFFAGHMDDRERGDFIKSFFNNTYVEKILSNGQRAGYRAWDDVLTLWRGAYLSREKEVFLRWPSVADTVYGMILLDRWLDPDERPLPSEAEQISFIEQAEAEKASAFTLSQEAIDYILCGGSGVSQGKHRIYEQFQKQEGKQENIKFLRDEYGVGGHSDAIPGSGYWEDHDTKGITISRDYGDPEGKFVLSWARVEKRIGELIAADRYLNRAEIEYYPKYQAQVRERQARWKIVNEFRSIVDDYVDFKTQLGEKDQCSEVLLAKRCADSFGVGDKKCYVLTVDGSFVLPIMRAAMQTIIQENTHLTERCEAMLAELNGPLAAPLEPMDEELNPPKKEYRFALGDTVHLGAQEYELLAFDGQTVRLFDPAFPIINKELPRDEFDRLLAENPLNDRLLQVVEEEPAIVEPAKPDTPGYDLGYGHLGNGLTVWNRLEEEHGDYKTIAHIDPDRTVKFYVDDLPEDVRAQIEEVAATSTMTISATQDAPVFSTPPLAREPDAISPDTNEPAYPPRDVPYIFCEWSESSVFQDKTAYSLHEFDRLMKQADDEHTSKKKAAMTKYGTWQKWYDANDPEFQAYLGYDKVKFTVVMPDGRIFTERQDIGDGDGGLLDFLAQYDKYREIVPVLQETARKEKSAAQSNPAPQPEPGPASGRFWDGYNAIKERNPDSMVLYQVGDFFELYGGEGRDATKAATALDLTLTMRSIPDVGRVPMCGFPVQALDSHAARLTGAGFDVIVARLEGNQHKTQHIPAPAMAKAKRFITEFCEYEYGEGADFSDLHNVAIGHSSTSNGEHFIDVSADLIDSRLIYRVDSEVVVSLQCHDLEDLSVHLANLNFDEMIAYAEEQYDKQREQSGQPRQEQETDDFSDIDPAAVRAALAESGIVNGHVVDPAKLDADPFIQQVMADVKKIAADELPFQERFSVIETENGYSIWDDVRSEIYVDSEGVREEFISEWQAEDYLKEIRQELADQDATEWLMMERAKIPRFTVELTSDAFADPFIIRDNHSPFTDLERYYSEGDFYLTFEDEEEAQQYADKLNQQAEKRENPGVEQIASYQADDERIIIFRYPNGKFYNHYGYDEQRGISSATAGGFGTFEEAEKTVYSHRPTAEKVLEPAEKTAESEKGAESLAKGHGQSEEAPAPTPPAPQRKAKVSPFVLHPEIPNADRHEYRITDDAIGVGSPGTRFNNNIRAIRLLKKLEREDRFATPEEQEVLAQYVGWGGLADCFDERHSKYAELKALLTEDEYESAAESTLTAFYTPPVVIRSIYQALENMGFKTGNLLEPSCGIGNFIGMRPETLADSRIYGIELDSISGRIARQLYQKSSIAVQGFEKTDLPDSFFDAAIGNVPFGDFKLRDKRYDKLNFLVHDYFFAKVIDKVRPGGIVAFITSNGISGGTFDKKDNRVRKYLAQRCDLIGAIRLPNTAFADSAGTDITTDILFLQKLDKQRVVDPDQIEWIDVDIIHENDHVNAKGESRHRIVTLNRYYQTHPEMVLGKQEIISGPFGPQLVCQPDPDTDLETLLANAIQHLHAEITEYVMDDPEAEGEDKSIPADPEVRNFSYTIVDGQVYYRENSRMNPVEVSVTAANRIKGLIGIRDCVRTLIEYQTEDWPDEDIRAEQKKLNDLYDNFVEKYGRINSRANNSAFSIDSAYFLLSSLEVLDDERNFVRKADMFTKRTIKQKVVITSVGTASEALAVSLAEKAKVDMAYMEELTGKPEPEIYDDLKGVIFINPMYGYGSNTAEKYLTADEYLSGNVREKLEWARRSAQLYPEDYAPNVEALERVQPVDLTASEISVRLGADWLPIEVIQQFMFELLDTPNYAQQNIKVHHSKHTRAWNIEGKSYDKANVKASNTYGTGRINAYKIIEETLNQRDVRIFDYVVDADGKRTPVLNKKETAIAQGKQELIKQAFQDWIWKDPQRREQLCQLYNVKFNSTRPREYDGSHLNFVGINPEITLRKHQVDAIAHILYGGNTLLAHVVGAGKTFEMVAAAQESKRLGLCQKSLFVVPNHLTEQWAAEYLQLYPSANILVATKKDFETKNRKRFCGRIATGDYDAIIIGHSQFEKIPMSVERQIAILRQQRKEILDGIRELKESHGDNFSRKQMERTKKSIEAKLEKLNDQSRKDDVVTFEELGIDRIFIDEAHYYKNLAAFSKMRNVGGISQTEAQKSSDLYMKCRYLDELTGGRGVIFATGTPISNTMVEMYTMQKYLQYSLLQEKELLHFDAWASTFGETVTAIELAPEGTGYRAKTRFSRFYNLPELMSMFKEVADIQTADMLNLPVPRANYHNIVLKPSEQQKEMVAALGVRAERVRNRMVDSSEDNMLLITNDGRKLALDQRLLNPMLPDSDTGKVSACAENVYEIWQHTAEQRSTQMVFCDLSTPKGNGDFNVYDDLRDKLIARGIPAEEIAYVHSANSEAQKKELFGKVRSGQIRVLIGSTQKMGAGTNVQRKLAALHHLDCPWRPSDLQQREGRIIRQGNENPEVDIYTYVTENTFDSYLYQLVEGKQKFIGQIMTSKSPVRSAEDIDETALSYAEIKALCTGNPHIKEKMDLDIDVQRLKLLKANHLSQRYALEDQIIKVFPQKIAALEQRIEGFAADMNRLKENTHPNEDGFSPMEVEGVVYTDKKAAGSAILAACHAMTSPDPVPLGQYRGFAMELSFESFSKEFRITLKGTLHHTTGLGTDIFGNILRLDNLLGGMEERLISCREQLENTNVQLANAKQEVEKPFPQEDELKAKSARLDELNILLNMDKPENEIVDGELNEGDGPARESSDRER